MTCQKRVPSKECLHYFVVCNCSKPQEPLTYCTTDWPNSIGQQPTISWHVQNFKKRELNFLMKTELVGSNTVMSLRKAHKGFSC